MSLLDKVKNTIRKYRLLTKGDRVLMGVSGGPDSVALLYILSTLKKEFKLTLQVAHFDHGLRKDSAKDAEFVRKIGAKLGIPVIIGKTKGLLKKGSLEQSAREERLKFLCQAAAKIKADKVALGHNLDDQAETVLMRILRGTGLYGLSAILPKRSIHGVTFIRPLLGIYRREIEVYLKQKRIRPRIDATNLTDVYFRNKIRNKLFPLLEKEYSPKAKELLSNLAQSSGADYDYLLRQAEKVAKQGRGRVNLKKFKQLHPAIRRLVLRLKFSALKGDLRRLGLQHIQEIEDLIAFRPVNSRVDLPAGISVLKTKNYLRFFSR